MHVYCVCMVLCCDLSISTLYNNVFTCTISYIHTQIVSLYHHKHSCPMKTHTHTHTAIHALTCTEIAHNITGPLPHSVTDFWRMVWQEKVETIAMVTNLKEGMKVKCEQYWPEPGQDVQLGPYMVTTVQQQCFPYYTVRKILLKVNMILWTKLLTIIFYCIPDKHTCNLY